ncbi:olfactory receptor 2K2-like [Anableps anableps]
MIWRAVLLWMENQTMVIPLKQPIVFQLEGFDVQPANGPFLFLLALLAYIVALLGNGVVICVIMTDKNLYRPMFVMICHLMVCDLLGATMVLPRLMMDLLMGLKKIAYIPAIAQAFCAHTYGTTMVTLLTVMAYDRYIAVCEPLRYHSIMTSARLHSCCALAWIVALLLIVVLFSFHMNVPLCGRVIQHVYCSNRGILNLACTPTPANNIYGLTITWTVSTVTFIFIAFSYIRILSVSLKQGRTNSSLRSKAFQTCAPHIVVYVLFQIAALILILSYRFPSLSQNIKKFLSILVYIIPPIINPIIYGLVSKDLRMKCFCWLIQTMFPSFHWSGSQPSVKQLGGKISNSKSETMSLSQKSVECLLQSRDEVLPQVQDNKENIQ